ncbi:hypothetical protein V0M98_38325 (plasmid) [Pseudomonas silesiensis]|uniref:hypothetical protein n=1 Tax=Pseudomonas silesiensis TaxID=1853130 RepID=UPI0030D3238E
MGTYIRTVAEVQGQDGWQTSTKKVFTNNLTWTGHTADPFTNKPFFSQNYTFFELLAGVRARHNGIVPIAQNRGLPDDTADDSMNELINGWEDCTSLTVPEQNRPMTIYEKVRNRVDWDTNGFSWVTAAELLAVDYDVQVVEQNDPGAVRSLRSALGATYFVHLKQLSDLGNPSMVRVLFAFSG